MDTVRQYSITNKDTFLKLFLLFFSLILSLSAFLIDDVARIQQGMLALFSHSDKLITDYVVIGGFGATFLNAGLLMAISIALLQVSKAKITGISIASVFIMGGFGMFGKNILNIWPILFGVFLYSRFKKQSFAQYIYIAFFGTCLAPIVSEVALWQHDSLFAVPLAILVGILVGFLLPPISSHALVVHQGYNLYNVGFAAGLIGTIAVSIMNSFGYMYTPQLIWYDNHHMFVIFFIYCIFLLLLGFGYFIDQNCIKNYQRVLKKSGRLISDFIISDGIGVVLFNMGLLGIAYTSFVLIVGGTLNGPTIGAILTVVGFGAFGKHIRNTTSVTLGVVLGTFVKIWNINEPAVLLGAIFATGLAPIAGQFGYRYGIVVGFLHLSLVLNIGLFHGGINLYNNGFSAGLIALFIVPLIESVHKEKGKRDLK